MKAFQEQRKHGTKHGTELEDHDVRQGKPYLSEILRVSES